MRCAIAQNDGEESKFPQPPYKKDKSYNIYPKAFAHLNFEIVTKKFNKRFPGLIIPQKIIHLRNAIAHGIAAEINKNGTIQLIKFKETKNPKKLKVDFSLTLEIEKIIGLKQTLIKLRRSIGKEINKNTTTNKSTH